MRLKYKVPFRLHTDLKYILRWTEGFSQYDQQMYKSGQETFIQNNCSYINCYMTTDKSLLGDPRNFDAILFDVENNWDEHPTLRRSEQNFIFMASESASNFPVCHPYFDSFYNWTWSYKLDSNILKTFLYIFDKNGRPVGPKIAMKWIDPMKPTSNDVKLRLNGKNKAVAWFVSNCRTKSRREYLANNLTRELKKHDMKIDIYGWCGKLTCPKDRMDECLNMLEENYYFFLVFENSLSEDYVTEKLMHALQHFTVPIVYGGANYSRFLPSGSYINAGEMDAETIVAKIIEAIKNPDIYQNYFRWHNHYVYKRSSKVPEVCTLCEMLNKPDQSTVVKDFRKWWNPNYQQLCEKDFNRNAYQFIGQ
ncbi:alpha-(1,3)-fucosyltransferase C-like [Bombyx mandarina]|nr:alpha-(1,3)-fucosyltransferase C-like [Bombyx mandarina]